MNDDELFSPWHPGDVSPTRPGLYMRWPNFDLLAWSEAGWPKIDGQSVIPKYWCGLSWRGLLLFRALGLQADLLDVARQAPIQHAIATTQRVVLGRVEEVARAIVVGRMEELAKEQRRRMDAFAEQFTAMHRKLDEMRQTRFAQWRATTKVEPPRALGPFAVSSSYTFMPNATAAAPVSTGSS